MKKFNIPQQFDSELIRRLKGRPKKVDGIRDFSPTIWSTGDLTFKIARHFGFCFGVEQAIEKAYDTLRKHPDKRIFFLSEMIHNPLVNKDLEENGIRFIQSTTGEQLIPWDRITSDDIVMIPAFGTTLETERVLQSKGIITTNYDTTCPFVELVWKRSRQLASKQATIIIHGKPEHEETRATFSHAAEKGKALVIRNMEEAVLLGEFISGVVSPEEFTTHFPGRYSDTFNAEKDLTRIGVVNQTTLLAEETQEIADYLKSVMIEKYGNESLSEHFEDTRDTLCYATNDNQQAVKSLIREEADFALIIGGHKSSNTTHLVELSLEKLPTYFIRDEHSILPDGSIEHFDLSVQKYRITTEVINKNNPGTILISSGASCPNSTVEHVILKVAALYDYAKEDLLQNLPLE